MNKYTERMTDIVNATKHDTTLYSYHDTLASARQVLITELQNSVKPLWLRRREYIQWWLDRTTSPYNYVYDDKGRVIDVINTGSSLVYNVRIYKRRQGVAV